ncbi:MAG: TetR/AcrR family transcriptional regulator [Bacteroidota bacterium]|nr:TetR/AcrR family transcriptional regulator [Bacteroidota bacterium]MDX5429135.1 TetR/AcrR family transcriptional regulator [Bacteroidota bacterium]MDX5448517.1 TetR/AcrR family transcriptional regulator [Bacteroidota bacterium]MDX5506783.1 TetR/AcrR family transcriptional regulator [Bacteroidota bacterium]
MEEQERQIVHGVIDMFMRYGIRSVTMDDVARELGVSKKTIYKFFSNKAELVDVSFRMFFSELRNQIVEVSSATENAIDELFLLDQTISDTIKRNHPGIFFQLRKYYPATYQFLFSERQKLVMELTRKNILKGIEQGLYRDDFNVDIISFLYYSKMLMMHQEVESMEECNVEDIIWENKIYHIRGIATEKGLQHLKNKLNKE